MCEKLQPYFPRTSKRARHVALLFSSAQMRTLSLFFVAATYSLLHTLSRLVQCAERSEFLEAMRAVGRSGEYERQIKDEIQVGACSFFLSFFLFACK